MDHLTRWVEAFPCGREQGEVAQKALAFLTCRYGAPEQIVPDNGQHLISNAVKE